MSYEKSLNDDREVTVGDFRILEGVIQLWVLMICALLYWLGSLIAFVSGSTFGAISLVLFSLVFAGFAWATMYEGWVRRVYSLLYDFETEALNGAEFGQPRESSAAGGDD